MIHDLRHALRTLTRRPAFTLLVVLTLALGLGANTALFTVVEEVVLSPLPFERPEELMRVYSTITRDATELRSFSYPDYRDLATEAPEGITFAAWDPYNFTFQTADQARRFQGERVSPHYFALLGVEPARGPGLSPLDSRATGDSSELEVVVSHGFWRQHLEGAEDVLESTVLLDGQRRRVVAVMPEGFDGLSDAAQLWAPFYDLPQGLLDDRGSRWHSVVARLEPGLSRGEAQQRVNALFRGLAERYPETNRGYGGLVIPLTQDLVGDLSSQLLLLLVAVGAVLLIACANVANLLLVRATGRRREIALCAALGAGRWPLVRRSLAEAFLLCALGSGLGLLLAWWGVEALTRLSPLELPGWVELTVDLPVLAFALALTTGTALLLGLLTALAPLGTAPAEVLSQGGRGSSGRFPLRRALVVTEVALALVLAVGAGLMLETWRQIRAVEPGYQVPGLALALLDLQAPPGLEAGEPAALREHRRALRERFQEGLEALPGVERVALADEVPLAGSTANLVSLAEDRPDPSLPYQGARRVYRHLVSEGYFETLGIPLLAGRTFSAADTWEAPGVAVVSETLARRLWPEATDPAAGGPANALGRRFRLGVPVGPDVASGEGDRDNWATVVGVAADAAHRDLVPDGSARPNDPDVYFHLAQISASRVAALVRLAGEARTAEARALDLAPDLPRHLRSVDSTVPIYRLETLAQRVAEETAATRFSTSLLTLFATLALLLAAVGIYGVVSIGVAERTREIGIRMALGADRRRVVGRVLAETLTTVALGVALGLLTAWSLGRFLGDLLFGVRVEDPVTLALGTLILLATAVAASLLPAFRAARVEPAVTLRAE